VAVPEQQPPTLAEFAASLGLPDEIASRPPPEDRTAVDDLLRHSDEQVEREHRNFHLGLMLAYLAVVEEICSRAGLPTMPDALDRFPPLEERGGRRLNTLTLPSPNGGRAVGLRRYYDQVEQTIRFKLGRRGYPSMAPHATQAWTQHREELEAIFAMTPAERGALANGLWDRVMRLPKPAYRTAEAARARPMPVLLRYFESVAGEPPGVTLQSLAYGYFNVEMSHLTAIESDKVRAGGARSGNVGDIDGWDASELVMSVEVKDLDLTGQNQHELHGFLANLVAWPDCTAIVVANSFSEEVVDALEAQNIIPLTRSEMIARAEGWDMPKQRRAVRAVDYYVIRVQAHEGFSNRYRQFLADFEIDLE
jgi:hypothetical protein